jgi:hypothetical protein
MALLIAGKAVTKNLFVSHSLWKKTRIACALLIDLMFIPLNHNNHRYTYTD